MQEQLIKLYDEYQAQPLAREDFIKRLIKLTGSAALAVTAVPALARNASNPLANTCSSQVLTEPNKSGYRSTEVEALIPEATSDINYTASDIEITDYTKGLILTTSDGTRARITLRKDINGSLYLQISDPL